MQYAAHKYARYVERYFDNDMEHAKNPSRSWLVAIFQSSVDDCKVSDFWGDHLLSSRVRSFQILEVLNNFGFEFLKTFFSKKNPFF